MNNPFETMRTTMWTSQLTVIVISCAILATQCYAFLPLMSDKGGNDCDVDCDEERHRPVCGNDGRTYNSRCDIDKAKCQGHPVEFKQRGKCPDTARCLAQRTLLQEQAKKLGMFIPECKEDGSYAEVQCHTSAGYCWCVDEAGKPIRGSSVRNLRPNCSKTGKRSNKRRSSRDRKQKKGCSSTDRASFNANLIDIFDSEYNRVPHSPIPTESGTESDPLTDTHEKAIIQWKFDQLDENSDSYLKKKEVRDLRRMAKKIVKPKACAKTFTKYCDLDQDKKISRSEWSVCLGVDINNEQVNTLADFLDDAPNEEEEEPDLPPPPSSLSVRPELWDKQVPRLRHDGGGANTDGDVTEGDSKEEEIQDCQTARRVAMDSHRQDPAAGIYIPECTPEGLYVRAQCHKSTQYCWCVHPRMGKPLRGTTTQGMKPDCDSARKGAKSFKGCSIQKKQEFLDELVQTFIKEMLEDAKNKSLSIESPTHEKAARWKFASIDTSSNQVLDKREWKVFKREWRTFHRDSKQRRRLRKCWRNLPRYCDENSNQKITMDEWLMCTGITRDAKGTPPFNHRRRGPNPFSKILKSD